jgi:hypothetical protein
VSSASGSPSALDALRESRSVASRRQRIVLGITAAVIVSVLILPRCFIDYGENGDAMDNAADAIRIARLGLREGILQGVRWPPGIPLFIYLLAAVVPWGGHVAANLLVFAFYIGSVLVFQRITRNLPNRALLTAMFALTPLLLVNAAVTQDFVPGTFFVLAAFLALDRRRYLLAGILLGIATGFRITNVLLILSAALYIVTRERQLPIWARLRSVVMVSFIAILCGLVWYSPFIYYSGLGWRYFVPTRHGEVFLMGFAYNTVYVWGPIALATIIGVVAYERNELVAWLKGLGTLRSARAIFALSTVIITTVVCFRFPNKVSYYLPAIPFFYLLLAEWVSTRGLWIIALAVVSFSFLSVELKGGDSGRRALRPHLAWGCVVDDWLRRREIQDLRRGIRKLDSLGKAVVLTGMAGVLTRDNDALVQVDAAAISTKLDPSAAQSIHRGVTDTVFQIKQSNVFLTSALSRANVRKLREDGFAIYMFSEYAPAAIMAYGYDPYQDAIPVLPTFTRCTFYHPCESNSTQNWR